MRKLGLLLFIAVSWFCCGNTAEAALFQDDFESNTTVSTVAWPDASGDFDPDAPTVGSWFLIEGFDSDVQVSSYIGGTQPTNAHSGSNYLIGGYHYETYGNWDHGGRAIANLSTTVGRARIDFWVWGEDGMHSQIDGKELDYADGSDAFSVVLTGSGEVKWNGATASATWTTGMWNHVVVDLYLNLDIGKIKVNDQAYETFSATAVETLGSVRFRGDTTVYYDDVLIDTLPEFPPTLFEDGFENNTTVSTVAWPDASGDFDPDAPTEGSWHLIEGFDSDVQVSSYVGGTQPTNALAGDNYLIAGYHYETYGNWDHGGRAVANLTYTVDRARIGFWVWGEDGMHCQVDGKELDYADGSDAFSVVLDGSGEVKWNNTTASATWITGMWNHVVIDLYLGSDTGKIRVNDQPPQTFAATGSETLGSIRFRGDSTVYYDDVLVETLPALPEGLVFQDDFDDNVTSSSVAWPDNSGDFDPNNALVGSWWVGEDTNTDVQVTSYTGGGQPTSAHSDDNYLITGWHNEVYGNWDHYGRAIANLSSLVDKATIDFWIWGEDNMHAQIVGRELTFGDGNGVFYMVLDGSGDVNWATGGGTVTATATWTTGMWNHVVIDLDCIAQSAAITVNNQMPEVFAAAYQGGAPTLGSIRFEGDKTPYYDDITVSVPVSVVTSNYAGWVASYPTLGSSTNYLDDPDLDTMNNLVEYALGGNPVIDDAASVLPAYELGEDGGLNWMYYIYNRRLDAAARQLTYSVVSDTDLVAGSMTNTTEEIGSSAIDGDFETVTNQISTDVESEQFMTLKVEINE